jgi:hypothetical protein
MMNRRVLPQCIPNEGLLPLIQIHLPVHMSISGLRQHGYWFGTLQLLLFYEAQLHPQWGFHDVQPSKEILKNKMVTLISKKIVYKNINFHVRVYKNLWLWNQLNSYLQFNCGKTFSDQFGYSKCYFHWSTIAVYQPTDLYACRTVLILYYGVGVGTRKNFGPSTFPLWCK